VVAALRAAAINVDSDDDATCAGVNMVCKARLENVIEGAVLFSQSLGKGIAHQKKGILLEIRAEPHKGEKDKVLID